MFYSRRDVSLQKLSKLLLLGNPLTRKLPEIIANYDPCLVRLRVANFA